MVTFEQIMGGHAVFVSFRAKNKVPFGHISKEGTFFTSSCTIEDYMEVQPSDLRAIASLLSRGVIRRHGKPFR